MTLHPFVQGAKVAGLLLPVSAQPTHPDKWFFECAPYAIVCYREEAERVGFVGDHSQYIAALGAGLRRNSWNPNP